MAALKERKTKQNPKKQNMKDTVPDLAGIQSTDDALDRMADEFGLLSSQAVTSFTGLSAGEILDKHASEELFAVIRDGKWLYPAFQFDPATRSIRPVIPELIKVAEDFRRTESGLALWMVTPSEYLDGERPVDCLNFPDTVLIAAKAAFSVQW